MKRERPATPPKTPQEGTGDNWMAYGGLRAYYREMEDWADEMTHWHRDAKERGVPCYPNCPDCREEARQAARTA